MDESKKQFPKSWKELGIINGVSIKDGVIIINQEYTPKGSHIYATHSQAKSALAMAQLSQLMKIYNGDWETNWEDDDPKYGIERYRNHIIKTTYTDYYSFLTFPTGELRDEFFDNFQELIKQYFEL